MVNACAVVGCGNRAGRNKKSFFRFPAILTNKGTELKEITTRRRKEWFRKIKPSHLKEICDDHDYTSNSDNMRVCSDHFISGKPAKVHDIYHPDWAPSQNLELNSSINPTEQAELMSDENVEEGTEKEALQAQENVDDTDTCADKPPNDMCDRMSDTETQFILPDKDTFSDTSATETSVSLPVRGRPRSLRSTRKPRFILPDKETPRSVSAAKKPRLIMPAKGTPRSVRDSQKLFIMHAKNKSGNVSATEMCFSMPVTHASTQTGTSQLQDLLSAHIASQTAEKTSDLKRAQDELNCCYEEIRSLKLKIGAVTLDEASFCGNDHKISFYTGLPNSNLFMTLLKHLEKHMAVAQTSRLTAFQQLLLTCMTLRLNLSQEDLAYRFQVSQSTVSRVFSNCIDVLYAKLKPCIVWPTREELHKTMPRTFRAVFGNKITVVIDCFEVFTERPSNILARAQMWSTHKRHNTVKYLIGISPQGSITFISDGWGGQVSDTHLTINSGILDLLLPGDVVLADRGFDIQEEVELCCAEVKVPCFNEVKRQSSAGDEESSRDISSLQVHVKRVIGLLRRKYTILNSTIPVNLLMCVDDKSKMDKIVTVCCALTNICPSVIPLT